jgi:hypothetical protein
MARLGGDAVSAFEVGEALVAVWPVAVGDVAGERECNSDPRTPTRLLAEDGLGLQVRRDAEAAKFAAQSRLFESAERSVGGVDDVVDHHAAGADLTSNLPAALDVAGCHVGVQTVGAVVRDLDRFDIWLVAANSVGLT